MLKRTLWALIFVGAAFVILDLESSFVRLCPIQVEQAGEAKQPNKGNEKSCGLAQSVSFRMISAFVDWVDSHHDFVNAASTLVIALFTIVLAFKTSGLFRETAGLRSAADQQAIDMKESIKAATEAAKAATTSNQIAVRNARQQLRAYVTARDINLVTHRMPATMGANGIIEGRIHTYGLAAILRNGGETPATNVTINVSCQRLAKESLADFSFPDSILFGYGLIGPDSEMHTPIIRVASADLQSIPADSEWFLWGWVEYDDIFSETQRHRTEFCFHIDCDRVPVTGEFWLGFKPYPRFNAMDGNCLRPIDPHTNESS